MNTFTQQILQISSSLCFEATNKIIEQIEMIVTLLALVKAMSCCFVFQIPTLSTLICGPKCSGLGREPKRSLHFQCYPVIKQVIMLIHVHEIC